MNSLPILRSASQLRSRMRSWRAFGETVALAPAGALLHEGHLALVRAAAREADRVVAVAVPRPEADPAEEEARLAAAADEAGADALLLPQPEELRPPDGVTELRLAGMDDVLCGEERPGLFADFMLGMTRLFNQSQADVAVFGERDWQRLCLMRRAAADLGFVTEVRVAPTERDDDGLAHAGAAAGLDDAGRRAAMRLWRELTRAAEAIAGGADADAALDAAADALADAGAEVEYLEMRDARTLAELDAWRAGRPARVFAAITLGDIRLIDNAAVGADAGV
jgi:pantoate--beta-alanine ligase